MTTTLYINVFKLLLNFQNNSSFFNDDVMQLVKIIVFTGKQRSESRHRELPLPLIWSGSGENAFLWDVLLKTPIYRFISIFI